MADKRILQERIVKFGITGMDEVYEAQKKIASNAKAALKEQKELLGGLTKGTEAYVKQAKIVDKANQTYERQKKLLEDLKKQANTVMDAIENQTVESAKKMEVAIKALVKGVKSISLKGMDDGEAEKMRGHIAGLVADTAKLQAQAAATTNGFRDMTAKLKTNGLAYEELSRYIKTYEQYGKTLSTSYANSGQALAKMGENATNAKIRMGQLDGTLLSVNKNTNAETLQAYIKGWQDIAKYGGASAEQVAKANEHIARAEGLMRDMMQRRVDNAGKTRFDGKELYSPAQVREAVEYMKQLSTSEKLTAEEREKLNASIKRGDEYLKQLTLDQQRYSMQLQLGGKQMSNIKTLSDASLASQKKYWTDMVASAERGTAEYSQYLSTLQAVTNEEQRRASQKTLGEGGRLVGQVNTGQFQGSIRETEEAIKKIQEYKKELKGPQQENMLLYAEQALTKLNEKLQQATTEAINGRKAFDGLEAAAAKGVDDVAKRLPNSTEELKRMRENLEAYKKSLNNPDTSTLQKIETMFTAIDKKQREVAASEINWANYKGTKLKERSVAELKRAYEVLKKEIEGLSPAQEGYNKKAMQMREIDGRLKQLNKTMGEHKTSLENAASRLKNYVLIYFGFNKAVDILRQIIQNTIALSDQMTNVRKVTGLTNLEIERMTNELQALDTRTANQQLMEMAEQAGKLGVATREGADGIVSFVKAGQEIVNTLGDIGGAEAITELLKVNDVVNKNATSIEIDLGKIGSAILNIGNNSKATYADVTEFTKRLGATGSAIGLSMEEIMGLGGAFSSLGESMERSSTATQRVMLGIVTRTKEVSQALNINYAEMDQLIQSGDTMGAFVMALKALNEQGVGAMEGFFKAIGGRNNQQARAAIALLSQHIDTLQYQVALAKEGFDDGTLVTQEFEKANNNLAGVMARVQNEIYEMTTAVESSNGALLDAAKSLLDFVKWLRTSSGASAVFAGAIAYAVSQVALFIVQIPKVTVLMKALWAQIVLSGQGIKNLAIVLFNAIPAFFGVKSAADRTTTSLNALRAAGMTNWITALITALGMLIGYLIQLKVASQDAAREMGEVRQKADEEMYALERLVSTLRRVWDNQKERQKGINEFNRKFGEYYGHLLKETASLNDLAIAYKAVAKSALEAYANELKANAASSGMKASREEREKVSEEISGAMKGKNINMGRGLSDAEREQLQGELEQTILTYWADDNIKKKSTEGSMRYLQNKYANDPRLFSAFGSNGNVNKLTGYNLAGEYVARTELENFSLYGKLKSYSEATAKGYKVQQRDLSEAAKYEAMGAEKGRQQADRIYQQLTNPDRTLTDQEIYDMGNEYISLMGQYGRKQTGAKTQMQQSMKEGMWDWSGGKKSNWTSFMLPGTKKQNAKDDWMKPSSGYDRTEDVRLRVAQAAKSVHPWGKTAFDWSEQYGGDLAVVIDFFDKFEKEAKAGQDFLKTSAYKVPTGVTVPQDINSWTKEQVVEWAHTNWLNAVNIQKGQNFDNDNGNFLHPSKGGSGKKPWEIAKDEFEAAVAALDQYYKDRETLIEISLNNEEITESEANRRKEALETEHLMKRSQLRRDAIGKMDDAEMKSFEGWWKDVKELDDVNFKKYREQSVNWGKAYVQKLGLASSKDLSEIEKMLQAHKQKIDKILEEGDSVKKVTDAFKTAMDDLDMIFALREEEASRTAALGNQRANQLMEWSKKAYSMEVSDLKAAMQETGNIYHAWFEALGDDQDRTLQAMLLRLRQYHDDMDEVVRKAAKERKRLFDMVYNNAVGEDGMTNQQRNTAQTDHAQSAISGQQLAQRWGYGGDNLTNNAELNLINLQIEQKLKYIEALKEQLEYETALSRQSEEALERQIETAQSNPALSGGEYSPEEKAQAEAELADLQNQLAQKRQDTANLELETNVLLADSEKELTELRAEQVDKQIENYQRMFDYLKEIQGEFEGFAESFGEGIFGSKEDRKNAALDLVADVLKTTKNIAQQYLVEIATKKSADQTIVALEEIKNTQLMMLRKQLLADYGAQKIAELSVEAATDSAGVTSAIAAGTSKEVAKKGLAGLATAAAIGVGLSLLLGLALGALSKARSATASATGASSGAGKLATGMLTYAKGRYPVYADGVFANDGNGRVQGQMVSVRGDDGRDYRAMYKPQLRTGVVNGPHLGIVGEKGAELIVDHGTYEGLKRYDPETLRRIYAMKMYGQRSVDFGRAARTGNEVLLNRSGVRRYADGNVEDVLARNGAGDGAAEGVMTGMQETLAELTAVLAAVKAEGIQAHMEYLGRNGARSTMDKGDRFLRRVGKG